MKKIAILFFLLFLVSSVFAQRHLGKRIEVDKWVDVRAYGAVGDGSTNDWKAINDAITYAVANSKPLSFPPGNFYVKRDSIDASQYLFRLNTANQVFEMYGAGTKWTTITYDSVHVEAGNIVTYLFGFTGATQKIYVHDMTFVGNQDYDHTYSDSDSTSDDDGNYCFYTLPHNGYSGDIKFERIKIDGFYQHIKFQGVGNFEVIDSEFLDNHGVSIFLRLAGDPATATTDDLGKLRLIGNKFYRTGNNIASDDGGYGCYLEIVGQEVFIAENEFGNTAVLDSSLRTFEYSADQYCDVALELKYAGTLDDSIRSRSTHIINNVFGRGYNDALLLHNYYSPIIKGNTFLNQANVFNTLYPIKSEGNVVDFSNNRIDGPTTFLNASNYAIGKLNVSHSSFYKLQSLTSHTPKTPHLLDFSYCYFFLDSSVADAFVAFKTEHASFTNDSTFNTKWSHCIFEAVGDNENENNLLSSGESLFELHFGKHKFEYCGFSLDSLGAGGAYLFDSAAGAAGSYDLEVHYINNIFKWEAGYWYIGGNSSARTVSYFGGENWFLYKDGFPDTEHACFIDSIVSYNADQAKTELFSNCKLRTATYPDTLTASNVTNGTLLLSPNYDTYMINFDDMPDDFNDIKVGAGHQVDSGQNVFGGELKLILCDTMDVRGTNGNVYLKTYGDTADTTRYPGEIITLRYVTGALQGWREK